MTEQELQDVSSDSRGPLYMGNIYPVFTFMPRALFIYYTLVTRIGFANE